MLPASATGASSAAVAKDNNVGLIGGGASSVAMLPPPPSSSPAPPGGFQAGRSRLNGGGGTIATEEAPPPISPTLLSLATAALEAPVAAEAGSIRCSRLSRRMSDILKWIEGSRDASGRRVRPIAGRNRS